MADQLNVDVRVGEWRRVGVVRNKCLLGTVTVAVRGVVLQKPSATVFVAYLNSDPRSYTGVLVAVLFYVCLMHWCRLYIVYLIVFYVPLAYRPM